MADYLAWNSIFLLFILDHWHLHEDIIYYHYHNVLPTFFCEINDANCFIILLSFNEQEKSYSIPIFVFSWFCHLKIILKGVDLLTNGYSVSFFFSCQYPGGRGNWSTEGCKYVTKSSGRITCHCDHMTNFAVLFTAHGSQSPKLDESHALALSIISYIGCAVSLLGVLLTFITYALFRWDRFGLQPEFRLFLCIHTWRHAESEQGKNLKLGLFEVSRCYIYFICNICWVWCSARAQATGRMAPSRPGSLCSGGSDSPQHRH